MANFQGWGLFSKEFWKYFHFHMTLFVEQLPVLMWISIATPLPARGLKLSEWAAVDICVSESKFFHMYCSFSNTLTFTYLFVCLFIVGFSNWSICFMRAEDFFWPVLFFAISETHWTKRCLCPEGSQWFCLQRWSAGELSSVILQFKNMKF